MSIDCRERIAIVCACKNRHSNLALCLPSWLNIGFGHVFIIDWGSSPSVEHYLTRHLPEFIHNQNLTIIRNNSPLSSTWILSSAYNIGFRAAKDYDFILKVDCDHLLAPDFLTSLPELSSGSLVRFYSDYSSESKYLSGIFLVSSCLLCSVNGFDERIKNYGWDESDLFSRIFEIANHCSLIKTNHISHVKHSDAERVSNQTVTLEKEIAVQLGLKVPVLLTILNRSFVNSSVPWGPHFMSSLGLPDDSSNISEPLVCSELDILNTYLYAVKYSFFVNKHILLTADQALSELYRILNIILTDQIKASLPLQSDLRNLILQISKLNSSNVDNYHSLVRQLFIETSSSSEIKKSRLLFLRTLDLYCLASNHVVTT